jgi:glycine betaine catabolism B
VFLTRPIRDVRPATPRARTVTIDLAGASFPYLAGQAVLVGAQGAERRRPYSIAAAPEESVRDDSLELLIGVDAEGSPGGNLRLEPGALVDIDGPAGRFTFPPDPWERRFLFIAGGTGIAPLRAMLHHALNVPHGEIGLLFSARTPAEFAYEQEFRSLAAANRIELELRVTREVAQDWSGVRGRLGREDLAPLVHGRATLCFVCGPPALVEEIPQILVDLGVPRERIKTEEWQ